MLCSVVCMTPTGKVLVAKGGLTATIPNFWSCGVFESNDKQMIDVTAKEYYMREFNADIDIFYQPAGETHRPIPISVFTANGGTDQNPIYIDGVYFAATLRNPSQIVISDRYTEFAVLDLVGLAELIGPLGGVPDLFYNIITSLQTFSTDGVNVVETDNPTDSLNMNNNEQTEKESAPPVENETLNMNASTEIHTVEEEKAEE